MFDSINKKIVNSFDLSSLSPEEQKEEMEKLGVLVYQNVMARTLDLLNEDEKKEFEKLVDSDPDPETLLAYMSEKVSNLDEIFTEEIEKIQGIEPENN